jgi:hypothetical protein
VNEGKRDTGPVLGRVHEPGEGDERDLLLGWLAFHRDALEAQCAGLTADQLAQRPVATSGVSLLGIVRHMAEMERVYGVWANGCRCELVRLWGPYDEDGPGRDFDCDASQVVRSLRAWRDEKAGTDGMISGLDLGDAGGANGRSVRWNVHKLLDEYARSTGQADLVRARVDAATVD